jgi:23S rRNA (uracil1939-C5)-methyltransferase
VTAAHRSIRGVPRRPTPPPPPDLDRTLHCRHFGVCGGCSLLDQPIQWQLHDKKEACEKRLQRFLGDVRIECAEPTWTPRHFRTRLLYPVRGDRDSLPIVGIYAFRSHELVRIEECRTQDEWLTAFGTAAEGVLREHRVRPYHASSGRGVVKAIAARLASGTGQVLAEIVTKPGAFPEGPLLAKGLQQAAAKLPQGRKQRTLVGVVHGISDRDDDFLLGDRHVPLLGQDHVVDRRGDLHFRISAGSFYQVHADADQLLYAPAMAMCGDVRGKHVVDGYGGVGTFGLRLAKAGAARTTIIEESASACRDAEHNATQNGLQGVEVVHSPFGSTKLPVPIDLLVVDPPRAGLQGKAGSRILAAGPRRILYVSCSVDSLAKDLAELTGNGYRVTAIRLADLFPHTEHTELLVMLERT